MRISDWSSDVCSSDLLGRASCFAGAPEPALAQLDAIIAQRERDRPTGSYTTRLFEQGAKRIAQKVGEEGVETALASVAGSNDELLGEAADLIYHLRSEEHTSELQSLMRNSYAVFCLKQKHTQQTQT